jgi:mRNA interferase MazF
MRPIFLAHVDKPRPAVLLTRELAVGYLTSVTVAPITTRIHGIGSEVRVGPENGLEQECVINCDNITTITRSDLLREIGMLTEDQNQALAHAISHAFDLKPTI